MGEALSAGVWYVAIDFQLFACAVLLLAALRHAPARVQRWAPGMVAAGGALSLLVFNRMPDQDMWAWYFWGSYSLGMCAFWAARAPRAWAWGLGMAAVGLLALWLEFRARIAVALVAALLLLAVKRLGVAWRRADWLPRLGQMSYSVFLVHFSVCLLVNAVVNHLWPDAPWPNAGHGAGFPGAVDRCRTPAVPARGAPRAFLERGAALAKPAWWARACWWRWPAAVLNALYFVAA